MIPADEETMLEHLVKALFDTAVLSGVTKSAHNHIEAITLVIKKCEFSLIHRSIKLILEDSLQMAGNRLQDLTKDLKLSIKDIKDSIAKLEEKSCMIDANMAKLSIANNCSTAPIPSTYTSILANVAVTPQFADPCIQA